MILNIEIWGNRKKTRKARNNLEKTKENYQKKERKYQISYFPPFFFLLTRKF